MWGLRGYPRIRIYGQGSFSLLMFNFPGESRYTFAHSRRLRGGYVSSKRVQFGEGRHFRCDAHESVGFPVSYGNLYV